MDKSCKCECEAAHDDGDTMELPPPPLVIHTSSREVSVKELFILSLFFILLMYAIISFLTQWNKNYREINYLPYYEIYQEETPPHSGEQLLPRNTIQLNPRGFPHHYRVDGT